MRLRGLYYITHIENVASVLEHGILCHEQVTERGMPFKRIYDEAIVETRRHIQTPSGRNLWGFANLYFQPRNAMLYRVVFFGQGISADDIAILGLRDELLDRPDAFITTGNAASPSSEILPASEGRKRVAEIRRDAAEEWWKVEDGSKRKMMAECLVPDHVPPEYIHTIYVSSPENVDRLKARVAELDRPVVAEPHMFFQPFSKVRLTHNLYVVEGDMFFSRMQTLTVSVNCVGVMGKGLASRAKYQFPDVYVEYQDLCREGVLRMGKPFLYKRESPFDHELADQPEGLTNANSETWFLLFPTKQHWKERADIRGIEEGLVWLCRNYLQEGIKSLAIPALGCGLGWLRWRDVGPLLCRYLASLDISVWVYLPAERKVSPQELTPEFLLKDAGPKT